MLDETFESDLVKSLYGFDAIVGNYAEHGSCGLRDADHAFGEVNGKKPSAVTPSAAWARSGRRARREATAPRSADTGVREVMVERGLAVGVILDNGTPSARGTSSPASTRNCSIHGWCRASWRRRFLARISHWRNGSGTFRMNVLLSALRFTPLPGPGDSLTAGVIIAPSLGYMDRAWLEAAPRPRLEARHRSSELLIPSMLDNSLSPPGRTSPACSASGCAGIAGRRIMGRLSRRGRRSHDRDVDTYAPGFAAAWSAASAVTARLERQFGLLGGDIFHGALTLNCLRAADAGPCRVSRPLKGLYHCGSGAHPGGGASPAPPATTPRG